MKKLLHLMVLFIGLINTFAQSPQIDGDLMLCPWTDGTASVTTAQTYDTYQWYSKYWFTSDPFVAIPGATSASFTYDWYTYDQSLFKVVVTLGGVTYESNEIQIDSYAWTSMTILHDLNSTVSVDGNNGNFLLCQGGSFNNTVNSPYDTNIQWYKNDVAIPGANSTSYLITEPGTYYVEAAPSFCPNNSSSNQGLPIVVQLDPNCSLNTNNPISNITFDLYPNPVVDRLTLDSDINITLKKYSIIDSSGKIVLTSGSEIITSSLSIDVSHLAEGFYILVLEGNEEKAMKKFIKITK